MKACCRFCQYSLSIFRKFLKDIDYISLDNEWEPEAAQACANLSAVGIVESQTLIHDELTRAEAAQMLIKALEVVKSR